MLNEITVLNVVGMSCNHCVNSVKKALENINGVLSVEVSLENKTATVEYNPEVVKVSQMKIAIEDEGYSVE